MIKEIRYKYDFINPSEKTNPNWSFVPSFRGENQLIIYTRDFEKKTKNNGTGVNPWGYEAAVNYKGEVIDLSDRVIIPQNGFVVSGNSSASKFIKENILLGSIIKIDYEQKEIIVKSNKISSIFISLQKRKKEFIKRYKKAKNNAYDINYKKIETKKKKLDLILKEISHLTKLEKLSKKEYNRALTLEKQANSIFDLLYLLTSPSLVISSRNAWTRPFEQNLEEIINTLETCKRCNINGIYVETFYNGNIPGVSKITETSEEVINGYYGEEYQNDYLKALISEAHKRKIEIHAWVECFFVGELSKQWKKRYKDSWHMVNYDGSVIQGNNDYNLENDFIWLDPANPECLDYILSIYKELLTNYEFDGINVDYVRYPYGNAELWSSNGYSEYAMNEFLKLNNLKGDVRKLVKDKQIHELWVQYRCNKITNLMNGVRRIVKEVRPSCLISTAVCCDLHYAIYNKMQNWKLWARNGWLDLTLPMAYYTGYSEIAVATKELVDFNKEKAFSYTGILGLQPGEQTDLVVYQINTLFDNKADGYAIFHLGDILKSKKLQHILQISTNKKESIHPHSDPKELINTFLKDIKQRKHLFNEDISSVIHKIKKIKDFSISNLINQLKDIKKDTNCNVIKKEIGRLIHYLNIQKNIKGV